MVMGEIVNTKFSLGNMAQAIAAYPESVWVTSFFAVFGLVIAIMKDVPGRKILITVCIYYIQYIFNGSVYYSIQVHTSMHMYVCIQF